MRLEVVVHSEDVLPFRFYVEGEILTRAFAEIPMVAASKGYALINTGNTIMYQVRIIE